MRLRFEATPNELETKGDELIKALIDEFHDVDHDLAERLEKALPPKESVLKYPVLRAIHKKTSQAYEAMLEAMLTDIGKVLDQSVVLKKSLDDEEFDLLKAKYTKRTLNPSPPPKYLYEYPGDKPKPREHKWERNPDGGYQLLGGKVKLDKRGNEFVLVLEGITEVSLGKRATFDSANKKLDELLAQGKKPGEKKAEPETSVDANVESKAVAKLEGKVAHEERGLNFETGKPVTFTFSRNLEASPKPPRGGEDRFQQKVEPKGRYMIAVAKGTEPLPKGIVGEVTFNKPIVIKENTGDSGGIYDEHSWKKNLSQAYGGKKGKALSAAIAKDGYDGIVTVGKHGTGEIVDLRFLHTGVMEKSLEKAMAEAADELATPVFDHTQPLAEKDGRAYNKVKSVLKKRGHTESDFELGGSLFGMSTNQLIDLARGDDATDG